MATIARDLVANADIAGTEVDLGGDIFVNPQEFSSEALGLLAAVVVLVAFGSVLAMGLPIGTALFGIGTGMALVGLLANLVGIPSFSQQAVMMIGLGVASTMPCSSSPATARGCTRAWTPSTPRYGPSTRPAGRCCSPEPP